MNKYDNSNSDLYDQGLPRRSPNMPPHQNGGGGSGNGGGPGGQNFEQMNAMMSMFNPMMAAFIQQLATQTNIMPPNGQSNLDQNGNPGLGGGGHHQWSNNPNPHHGGDFSRNSAGSMAVGAGGMPNLGGGGGYNQTSGSGHSGYSNSHSRYKN